MDVHHFRPSWLALFDDDNSGESKCGIICRYEKYLGSRSRIPIAGGLAVSRASTGCGSLKNEYLDDFADTCRHVDQLSQAIPANKYAWRPGAGVRSVSDVYVHIANGNLAATRKIASLGSATQFSQ